MKKYMIATLCIVNLSYSAEKPTLTVYEWSAELYDKGNRPQEESFLHFLKDSNIDVSNKKIVDIGCGTGNITNKLAEKAKFIMGIDPSNNMISFARTRYNNLPNIDFTQGFAETFDDNNRYDLAIASHSFHWFKDKPLALKMISHNLEENGELFFNALTSEDPKPVNLIAAEKMMLSACPPFIVDIFSKNRSESLASSYPAQEELKQMLEDAGFNIVSCKQLSCEVILKNREEIEDFQRPILMSRPIVQYIPEKMREYFFSLFIDEVLLNMQQNENKEYIAKLASTIVHARKK